jgi:hypothetical protein
MNDGDAVGFKQAIFAINQAKRLPGVTPIDARGRLLDDRDSSFRHFVEKRTGLRREKNRQKPRAIERVDHLQQDRR